MATEIESILVENRVFQPPEDLVKHANVSGMAEYQALCDEAERDPEAYWTRLARENLEWTQPFTQAIDGSEAPFYKWFTNGQLNVSANCLDKHLGTPVENRTALIFEADDGQVTQITYKELHARVSQFANALKSLGHKTGERAIIYLPMSIEAVVAMQACARLGIIHSVVFGGFSSKSIHERTVDVGATLVITADAQMRGSKVIALKDAVDEALTMGGCEAVSHVITYKRADTKVAWDESRDLWWHDVIQGQSTDCPPVALDAEHPLFILYTSGSTGKPKGVQHAAAGFLLWSLMTMKWTFDAKPDDVFWCTADVGWVTGHSYVAYGPLAAGVTQVVFEGVPTYPDAGRFWRMIQDHKVSVFYTAPTAIRSLTKLAESDPKVHPDRYNLDSLRIIGSVGEPINPEAWVWYYKNVGRERCPVLDTWWQTETGAHMLTP
ncbi:MAG: AMP-binding protein, partial [Alcaligenaceae bacterium]|nr:AMP-binding protein [Alcaligenaceae bacterium]